MNELLAGFDEWAAQVRADGKEDEMIAWGNILAAAIRRGFDVQE